MHLGINNALGNAVQMEIKFKLNARLKGANVLHEIRIICFTNYDLTILQNPLTTRQDNTWSTKNVHFSREFMTLPPNRIDSDSFAARNSFFGQIISRMKRVKTGPNGKCKVHWQKCRNISRRIQMAAAVKSSNLFKHSMLNYLMAIYLIITLLYCIVQFKHEISNFSRCARTAMAFRLFSRSSLFLHFV